MLFELSLLLLLYFSYPLILEGCNRVYFSFPVRAEYLEASLLTIAIAKHHKVELFVNMSQVLIEGMKDGEKRREEETGARQERDRSDRRETGERQE